MITLYDKLETDFQHNGLGSLDQNIIDPKIHWTDNGVFSFEFEYPLFAKHGLEITNSSIIKARDPEQDNLFFVYKIVPNMGYIKVYAYQIFYKLAFNTINDTNIVNKTGQGALTQMAGATQYSHKFKFTSDISSSANSRVVRKNPVEFLLDSNLDNSFVNRWGGHIIRHGFNISMDQAYGSNKGYKVQHKKDLLGYEATIDETTIVTRIRPVGYDGLLLPEIYIDSPLINNYPEPRIQEYEYSDIKVGTEEGEFATAALAYAELRRLAKLEFSQNKIDVPRGVYKIDFVNLKETEEYKNFAPLKQILPGDIVAVKHEEDGIDISAQMVEYNWNPLLKEYIDLTLGNYERSFTSTVSKLDKIQTDLKEINNQIELVYLSADGKTKTYISETEPVIDQNSTEGDMWIHINGDKKELWFLRKINSELQWVVEISDATQEELKALVRSTIEQADTDRQKAEQDFRQAVTDAKNYTELKVNEFDNQLITVNQNVLTATNSANDAVAKANQAIDDVGFMRVDVDAAKVNATDALTQAQTATDNVSTLSFSVDELTKTVGFKADSTRVDNISGLVDQHSNLIEANAQAINARLTSAQVETLLTGKKYVNETTLNATANGLNTSITQVSTDLSNLEIGGRNLLKNTSNFTNLDGWTGTGLKIVEKDGYKTLSNTSVSISTVYLQGITGINRIKLEADTEYIYSARIMFDEATKILSNTPLHSQWQGNGSNGGAVINQTLLSDSDVPANTWVTIIIRGKTKQEITNDSAFVPYIYGLPAGTTFWIQWIQFKQGNKFEPYSPAFEDYATVEQFTTIDATVKGLQTTVGNKAEQSQVTQLAGQISSKVESATYNSKMTQLDSAINLRVTKGDVTAQINVEAGVTLISNKKLLLDANTYIMGTTFANDVKAKSLEAVYADIDTLKTRVLTADVIDSTMVKSDTALITKLFATDANVNVLTAKSAFINAIKAVTISADKITGGTINGENVNVINLNANNITAGTLKGTNLSLNLSTGEVLFQKGIIKRSDNLFNIDITKGRLESYSSQGGMTFQNGTVELWKRPKLILDTEATSDLYGKISYTSSFLSAFSGMGVTVEGTDGAIVKTTNYRDASNGEATGSGIIVGKDTLKLDSQGSIRLRGGKSFGSILPTPPEIAIGVKFDSVTDRNSDISMLASGIRLSGGEGRIDLLSNGISMNAGGSGYLGDTVRIFNMNNQGAFEVKENWLSVRADGQSPRVVSMITYNRTYSSAANMYITGAGTFGRATSASKYKLNISEIPNINSYAERVLAIKPKQWFDKTAVELYAKECEQGCEIVEEDIPITPFYGLIAEDLVEAGLEKYVQYGSDGKEVEGIMYDRLWTLLIPIVKQQKEQIEELQQKIKKLESAA